VATRRRTALLVDDDREVLEKARWALEQEAFDVRTATDGSAALAALGAEPPDVIVMELGLTGEDVIGIVKSTMEWVSIPIVLYSRAPLAGRIEAQVLHGADEFVPKTAGAHALAGCLAQLLQRSV